jgi:hypothetical protein
MEIENECAGSIEDALENDTALETNYPKRQNF